MRRRLILVDRETVRRCAELLRATVGWRRRPLRRLIDLIYTLNTLYDGFALRRYDNGLPRPSVVLQDLSRLSKSAHKAKSARNTERLVRRISLLAEKRADSVSILAGLLLTKPRNPSIPRDKAVAILLKIAESDPRRIVDLIEKAQALNYPISELGKGGRRAKPSPSALATLDTATALYSRATGLRMLGIDQRVPQVEIGRFNRLVGLLHRRFLGPISGHALRELISRHYPIRAHRPVGRPRIYRQATRKPRPRSI